MSQSIQGYLSIARYEFYCLVVSMLTGPPIRTSPKLFDVSSVGVLKGTYKEQKSLIK